MVKRIITFLLGGGWKKTKNVTNTNFNVQSILKSVDWIDTDNKVAKFNECPLAKAALKLINEVSANGNVLENGITILDAMEKSFNRLTSGEVRNLDVSKDLLRNVRVINKLSDEEYQAAVDKIESAISFVIYRGIRIQQTVGGAIVDIDKMQFLKNLPIKDTNVEIEEDVDLKETLGKVMSEHIRMRRYNL